MANKMKGIAVPFTFNVTGYPAAAEDMRALHDSIFTILSTTPGERVMRPEFGSWLIRLISSNLNTVTALRAREEVFRAVGVWEPRVDDPLSPNASTEIIINIDWEAVGTPATTTFSVVV